jgi:hypothetical protein
MLNTDLNIMEFKYNDNSYEIKTIEENEIKEFAESLKIGNISEKRKKIFRELIEEFKEICALNNTKLGETNVVKHQINTGNNEPIAMKPYKADIEKRKIIKDEIEKMEKAGIIRKGYGPWASPVVIVGKKDGSKRFCIDYRKINNITITDAHPLPRIDDLLEQMRMAKWFTTMDLASGYWQIAMEEEDKVKTAFTCPFGLYEFNRMPFGLKNAPPTFQRLMNDILKEFLDEFVVVYIDDILIYSENFEEHIEHIRKVFEKLREVKLKIKLKKCKFCEENIGFLGHIVGKDGLKPDPRNIKKIQELEKPKNISKLRSILGLCGYYRRFVKGFSGIAKPMNKLLQKQESFIWTEKQQKAFEILKERLVKPPILQYPNYEKSFILFTDASGKGLGAVLSQLDENEKEVVIAYASKSLNKAEQNYHITDQECLAVIWAIQHFHKYLLSKPFTVITDHSALKGLMTANKISKGRRARWTMELQQYDFIIKHRSGKSNTNADALSRLI